MTHFVKATVPEDIFVGGGDMGVLMRGLDWSQTPLGPVSEWAQSLKTIVSIILNSRYPMFVWWGAEYATLYNDAYRLILGASKHPQFLGQSAKNCWAEIWNVIGPLADSVRTTGQPTCSDDLLLIIDRYGYLEETYFTFSYSPVRDESGGIGGVFCVCMDNTERVLGERRLRTVRELASNAVKAKNALEACRIAKETLSNNPADIPFALLYLVEADGKQARLVGTTTSIEALTPASLEQVDLTQETDGWHLAQVRRTGTAVVATNLTEQFGALLGGSWSESPHSALVMPLAQSGKQQLAGLLVIGISPRRAFDDEYRGFFDLVKSNVATAIANADAYEAECKRAEALADQERAKTTFFSNRQSGACQEQASPREAEAARSQISNIFESITDAFVAFDPQWRYTYVNEQATRLLQKTRSELLGKQVWSEVFPETVETLAYQELHRAVNEQVVVVFEEFGQPIGKWLEVHAYPSPEGVAVYFRDITNRKLMEEELRRREQQFSTLVENLPDVIFRLDLDLRHLYICPTVEKVSGIPPQQFLGRTGREVGLPAHTCDLFEAKCHEAIATGQVTQMEFSFADRQYRTRIIPEYALSGSVESLMGITDDITERKRMEEALRESEEFNRSIFESSGDCIKVLDLDGCLLSINGSGLCLMEIEDCTAVLGKPWIEFWQDQDRNAVCDAIEIAKAGGIGRFSGYCPTAKGNPKWWDVIVTPVFDAQGKLIKRLVSTSRDLTERKRAESALVASEARLRSFVEANVVGILFGDVYGSVQFANDELLRIVGYTREDLYTGRLRWIDITPPEFLDLDEQHIAEAQVNGACTPYEKEYIRKDGSRVPVLVGYSLVGEARSESVGFILDISDRKRALAERDRLLQLETAARAEAEAANRVKDEFLAVLSHELRSPLNPIVGWSTLLRSRKLDEKTTDRALEIIERSAKVQAQLIEDLLDISRILQGKLSLNVCPVDLASTIQAAMETVRLPAQAKSIQLQTMFEPDVGQVLGDAARLQQVIWNLLSNAVKFTQVGGRVDIRLARVGSQAQITVSDTGKGIPPAFLPHVFDYFRQADATITRTFGGLGLGLAIVRQLVELHGGTVQADSPGVDRGAIFTVKLPLMPTQPKTDQDREPSEQSLDLNGVKVLVVDDDESTREFVAFLLEMHGASVTSVASAGEALVALTQSKPDVLLSDIGMPEIDGYMLMRQIRTLPPEQGGQIPAIALSAYAGEINYQQALRAGFQSHVSKPVDPITLVQKITDLVGPEA